MCKKTGKDLIEFYKVIAVSLDTYGSESWALNTEN
jgi:hypothetical protein